MKHLFQEYIIQIEKVMEVYFQQEINNLREVKIRDLAFETFPFDINGHEFFSKHVYSGNQLLNGINLHLRSVKRIDCSLQAIHFLSLSQELALICGGNIIAYNPNKKTYRYLTNASKVQKINVAVDKNSEKQYIAFIERKDLKKRSLSIYDCIRKCKISHYQIDQPFDDYISCIFITGSFHKIVGFIVNNSQGCVVYYTTLKQNYVKDEVIKENQQFYKQKVNISIRDIKSSIYNMSLFGSQSNALYELKFNRDNGRKLQLRLSLVIQVKILEQIVQYEINQNILVIRTDSSIYIYSVFEYRLLFSYKLQNLFQNENLFEISCMSLNQNSLIIFHYNSQISILNYSINGLKLLSTSKQQDKTFNQILKVFLSPNNSQVIVVSQHSKIQNLLKTKPFNKLNLIKNTSVMSNLEEEKTIYLEITTSSFSNSISKSPVNKLICKEESYKNILVAPWVNQYFIQTNNKIIAKNWQNKFDQIKCSCIHPTGQYLLIGFNDCYKIYLVTIQGLQNTYMGDGVKDCQSVAYSIYGNDFAIASTNSISIYNSYSFCKLQFIQLQLGIQIEELTFFKDSLMCTNKNKKITLFSSYHNYKQIISYFPKNYLNFTTEEQINSIFYDRKLDVVIFSLFNKIYFINAKLDFTEIASYDFDNITCMEYSQLLETLFLGTQNGEVIAFQWPNNPINIINKLPKYHFHAGKVKKIKISSNYKYLISIGQDGSLYKLDIQYVSQMRVYKTLDMIQQKKGYLVTVCGLMDEKNICHYTSFQWNVKIEEIRKLQEEVMITCFISPQQRQRQKNSIVKSIDEQKNILSDQCKNVFNLLQTESINFKSKIFKLKRQILTIQRQYSNKVHQANILLQAELISANQKKQEIKKQYNSTFLRFRQSIEAKKLLFKQQLQKLQAKQNQILNSKSQQNDIIIQELVQFKVQYQQLNQIQKEKQLFKEKQVKRYEQQIALLTCRNGQLVCVNSKLQKQICMKKRKIQQTKEIAVSTLQNIKNIKRKLQKTQQVQQVHLSSIEKRYIQMNRRLISGQKSILINLTLHEKQNSIIILLEKTLQNTEKQIEKIIQDIFIQKNCKKEQEQKLKMLNLKIKQLIEKVKNNDKLNVINKNKFKDLIHKVRLYLQNFIPMIDLQKITKIRCSQKNDEIKVVQSQNRYSQNLYSQKKVIGKIKEEQKVYKLIKNQKNFYSTCKKKMNINSQDLIQSYNILKYQNTNLFHKVKNYQGFKKNVEKLRTRKRTEKQNSPTPFQSYINRKMNGKRVQTLPSVQIRL